MRQWLCNPKILCKKHLTGEHCEHHMFVGSINLKRSVSGFIEKNLLEPLSLKQRHDELAEEMKSRGYKHKTPLKEFDLSYLPDIEINHKINTGDSLLELLNRCPECKKRFLGMDISIKSPLQETITLHDQNIIDKENRNIVSLSRKVEVDKISNIILKSKAKLSNIELTTNKIAQSAQIAVKGHNLEAYVSILLDDIKRFQGFNSDGRYDANIKAIEEELKDIESKMMLEKIGNCEIIV